MENVGRSMLMFWISYAIVTLIGMIHTIFNIYVLHMKPMDEHGMGEGYERTKPWHPLYNIVLFTIFGWLYLRGFPILPLRKPCSQAVSGQRFALCSMCLAGY